MSSSEGLSRNFDYIDIGGGIGFYEGIYSILIETYGIDKNKIQDFFLNYRKCMKQRYVNKEEALKYIDDMNHGLAVLNFRPALNHSCWEVFIDDVHNMKYVLFEGKKMYLRRRYPIFRVLDKEYVHDFWYEQDPNSPHRYMDEKVCVAASLDNSPIKTGGSFCGLPVWSPEALRQDPGCRRIVITLKYPDTAAEQLAGFGCTDVSAFRISEVPA